MNLRRGLIVCVLVCGLAQSVRAADGDLNITSQPKRFQDKTLTERPTDGVGELRKIEHWGYSVTLENKTFKPLDNLEVQYIIFYKHEQFGEKGPAEKKRMSGIYTVKEIDSLGSVTFDTSPVELTKATLFGGLGGSAYFTNGARATAADSLTGLWVRVMQNGTLFSEFSDPSDLSSTEQWQ